VEVVFTVAGSCAPCFFDYGNGLGFVEAGQVEEVGVLVEFVKDGAGAVFDVGCGEDGDAVWWEGGGEGGTAVEVFERGYVWCYCGQDLVVEEW